MTTHMAREFGGLKLVNRFDFDPETPGNRTGPHWTPSVVKKKKGWNRDLPNGLVKATLLNRGRSHYMVDVGYCNEEASYLGRELK